MSIYETAHVPQIKCVFHNISDRCSNEKNLDLILFCKKHGQIFNLEVEEETLVSGFNKNKMTFKALKYTDTPLNFLPFPFNYDTVKNEFCLNRDDLIKISTSVSANSNIKLAPYILFLQTLLSDGIFFSDQTVNINYSALIRTPHFMQLIETRWKDIYIKMFSETDAINIEIPIAKLPLFYRILLYYAEIATVCKLKIDTTVESSHTFSPNLILNMDAKYFQIIDNAENKPLFIKSPDSTFASSVILLASVATQGDYNQHSLFTLNNQSSNQAYRFPTVC